MNPGLRWRSPYDRDIVRLAVPALGALAAEPLYLLVDTAMVGHLGTDELAALFGMLAAALGVFVPVALLSLALDWGIVGVWAGLVGLIAVRLVTCGWRFSSRRWALVGAPRH